MWERERIGGEREWWLDREYGERGKSGERGRGRERMGE